MAKLRTGFDLSRVAAYIIKCFRLACFQVPELFLPLTTGIHGHDIQGQRRDPHIRRRMSPRCISPCPTTTASCSTMGPLLVCPPADVPFESSRHALVHIITLHHDLVGHRGRCHPCASRRTTGRWESRNKWFDSKTQIVRRNGREVCRVLAALLRWKSKAKRTACNLKRS